MTLRAAGPQQMHDFVTAREEQLRDQASVALGPEGLRTHEARDGLLELRRERRLPRVGAHARGVAAERADANAREALLAGLAAPPAAELLRVPVGDPRVLQRRRERS